MNKFIRPFLLLMLFFITACDKYVSTSSDPLDCLVENNNIQISEEYIVLIPTYGCSSCRNSILEYCERNPKKENVNCIIYGEQNKANRIMYGKIIDQNNNIIFDSTNCIKLKNKIYPYLLYLKNKQVVDSIEVTAENIDKVISQISADL